MGLIKKYNERIGGNQFGSSIDTGIIRNPNTFINEKGNTVTDFNKTSLDLENPQPLGGLTNISYTTQVGEDIVTSPTTQPYTPQNTYSDSFTSPTLKARTIDPKK
jgi:hypothetical protein|tara:strand:+ start:247 stop:561 length:315 start_codon:yes stop_codon:yes gene_type:complete